MRGSIRLLKIFGISINVHITFLILPVIFFAYAGFRGVFLILTVFVFVTAHELCHSLVAKRFGIKVPQITLLPIGGVATMGAIPEKPYQEFAISVAGPLFNVILGLLMFFPIYGLVGREAFFKPSLDSWPQTFSYLFWINPILAAFNLLPAFPMDGGRLLRAAFARKLGYRKATEIAVNFGHAFALIFAFIGILYSHIMLIVIAVFIYMAASNEGTQVEVKEILKNYRVSDILPGKFLTLTKDVELSKVLEIIFHQHQEDFPVLENHKLVGFLTRNDVIYGMHQYGPNKRVGDIMRMTFPKARPQDSLVKVQSTMHKWGLKAVPVLKDDKLCGIITLEDISRVYIMMANHKETP